MRTQLGFHMPCLRSIYNYFPIKQLQPGFNSKLEENLRKLTKKMTKRERQAILICDEISIKRDLEYNESLHLIDGFQHLSEEDRAALIWKQVCVFIIRGLYSNWKYVLNYFVTEKGINGEQLKKIVLKNIKKGKQL